MRAVCNWAGRWLVDGQPGMSLLQGHWGSQLPLRMPERPVKEHRACTSYKHGSGARGKRRKAPEGPAARLEKRDKVDWRAISNRCAKTSSEQFRAEAGGKLRRAGKLKEHRFRWSLIFSRKARANAENRP